MARRMEELVLRCQGRGWKGAGCEGGREGDSWRTKEWGWCRDGGISACMHVKLGGRECRCARVDM